MRDVLINRLVLCHVGCEVVSITDFRVFFEVELEKILSFVVLLLRWLGLWYFSYSIKLFFLVVSLVLLSCF